MFSVPLFNDYNYLLKIKKGCIALESHDNFYHISKHLPLLFSIKFLTFHSLLYSYIY